MGDEPGAADLRIYLFGDVRLVYEGAPYKVTAPPKTLPLLAYLILHAGSPLERDSVAFCLWPDETEEHARANLRRHLYHLTRVLPRPAGQPWLESSAESLQWNAASAWVDVFAFRRFHADRDFEAAVALYSGDLLEHCDDEWVLPEREALRTDYVNALYALVVEHRSRRQWASAIRRARVLLQADPWREDTVRQLMSVQYESGDRAGALQTYAEFRRRLRKEMAVDPMPETRALWERITSNAPLSELPRPPSAPSSPSHTGASPPSLPFVGRRRELERLGSLWDRAAHGTTTFALVEGEAGIGKSRLAAELALRVEAEGGRVVWGTTGCPESGPYQALSGALRQALPLITALPLDPRLLAAAATLVPELRLRRTDLPRLAPAKAEDERHRLLEAVAGILAALATSRPLLVVLEDLHWAGEATLKGLALVASLLRPASLFVLVTYREEEVTGAHPLRWLQRELTRLGPVPRITPRRLAREDVENLVAQLPALNASPGLPERLHERSEGHCLFLALLIGDMLDVRGADSKAIPPGDSATSPPAVPSELERLIAARLARLSASARSLADVAAVIGQGFGIDLVSAVSGWSMDQVLDGVNELLDHRLIRELAAPESFQYAFSHHLIGESIYGAMPSAAATARHRRIARVLAEQTEGAEPENAAELARHFERGGEPDRAAAFYVAAARYALKLYADAEALAHLELALSLSSDLRTQADALLLLEQIHARGGLRGDQTKDLAALERLADELQDAHLRVAILERRIVMERALGNRDREERGVEEFGRAARGLGERRWMARSRLAAASYAMHTGRLEPARMAAQEALEILDGLGDADSEVEGLCLLADIQTQLGRLDEAESLLERARKTAETGGQPALVARAYLAVSRAAIMQHQFARCLEAAQAARSLFLLVHDREGEADALVRQASVLARLQRYEEARVANRGAGMLYEAIGKDEGRAGQLVGEGSLAARLGLLETAEERLLAAEHIFQRLGELRGLTVCALNLGFLYLVQRRVPEAEACARRALDHAHALNHKIFTAQALANLGAVEREMGLLDRALEHMVQSLRTLEDMSRPADLVNDLADLALTYLAKGAREDAKRAVDRMLSAAEESLDAAFWPQGLLWTAARVYRACGKRKRAAELLQRARDYALKVDNSLEDATLREHYKRLPVNQEIFKAYDSGQWP